MITPSNINLNKKRNTLTISFEELNYPLSSEFLRVYSPSAEVQGHKPEDAVLQLNKENVLIQNVRPMGNYAVVLHFDDGHDTGIYSWSYLHHLAINQKQLWAEYLQKVSQRLASK
ncbi:MAG: DUF971 domain-containing protein [Gammaproteobacteria bacterium]|nr:DUF971 domain-containing protein [Gammaproteobacteria bacterium]